MSSLVSKKKIKVNWAFNTLIGQMVNVHRFKLSITYMESSKKKNVM